MPEPFDAYHKWLGIPPQEQPPNHYRILGLGLYESDRDVISNAADRQMAHVRTFQSGPHGEASQKILNEIAAARVCLLKKESKAAYDQALKKQLAPRETSTPSPAGTLSTSAAAPVANQPGQPDLGQSALGQSSLGQPALGQPQVAMVVPQVMAQPYAYPAQVMETGVSVSDEMARAASGAGETHLNFAREVLAAPQVSVTRRAARGRARPSHIVLMLLIIGGFAVGAYTIINQQKDKGGSISSVEEEVDKLFGNDATEQDKQPEQTNNNVSPTNGKETSPPNKVKSVPGKNKKPDSDRPANSDKGSNQGKSGSEPTKSNDKNVPSTNNPPATNNDPGTSPPQPEVIPAKPAPPSGEVLAKGLEDVRGKFEERKLAAKGNSQKVKLASEVLGEAILASGDLTRCFALLTYSSELGGEASDCKTILAAIDEMDRWYQVKPLDMKRDALRGAFKLASSAQAKKNLIQGLLTTVDDAVDNRDFAAAKSLIDAALECASAAQATSLEKKVHEKLDWVKRIELLHDSAQQALARLKTQPDDPAASANAGKYLALVQGDWAQGLPLLAKCNEPVLSAIAKRDLRLPTDAVEQFKLGSDWWDYGLSADPDQKLNAQQRAGYWYELAESEVSGAQLDTLKKRLAELSAQNGKGDGDDDDAAAKEKTLAESVPGKYSSHYLGKKSKNEGTVVLDFLDDHRIMNDKSQVGTWEIKDKSLQVTLTQPAVEQPVQLRTMRRKGELGFTGTYLFEQEAWKWDLSRMELVAVWEHRIQMRSWVKLSFYSNGYVGVSPAASVAPTWKKTSPRQFEIYWPAANPQGKPVTDKCTVAEDGKTYTGVDSRNRELEGRQVAQ